MSQTRQSEAEALVKLLAAKNVEELKVLRAAAEQWVALLDLMLERAERASPSEVRDRV